MSCYLAIDIGASSGRHILGYIQNGKIVLEEIHRFENQPAKKGNVLCWDLEKLFSEILFGIRQCAVLGKIPATAAIDTWGVDFVLIDKNGAVIGDTVAYRDNRTEEMDQLVEKLIDCDALYARTGIQKQIFNTIYQLMAVKQAHPEQLTRADRFLMIPEYLNFRLTGVKTNEYTNATTTQLVNAREKNWDMELLEVLGYPKKLFGPLNAPKATVGRFTEEIKKQTGFDCTVVLPATHDTGSAFLAVPAKDDDAVTISSGTWSLLGVENDVPITTPESRSLNFTNEGGYDYRFRYLKNIMGLWIIQSVRRETGRQYSYAQLEEMAKAESGFASLVDVNDQSFLTPDSMIKAIRAYCVKSGQTPPESIGQVMACVYRSLAKNYADAVRELQRLTGKRYASINIVGGGSKDGYLNQLTAKATGLPVYAGPSEGTALGNLMAQIIAAGEFPDLAAARKTVRESFEIKEYHP